ncbi:External alternative NAD(P)H-ubiquinone oxidoreductase B3, mitochondrial [Glycine soja]
MLGLTTTYKMWFLAVDGSYFFLKIAVDGSFSNFHRSITLKCPTVQTGCQVVVVNDKDITVKVKSTGDVCLVSHGLIVYTKRHVLATNEWLRVKGCEDVYAIGDCSSITQRKIMDDITSIFEAAGKNNSGTLTIEEFQEVMDDISLRYPQEIDIEVFKLALYHADSQVKSLPATAQVAAQQGAYLARCLNCRDHAEENPEGPHDLADLDVISFLPSGIGIWDNLLHCVGSRQLQNFLETGFPWATALNGFGILYMQASRVFNEYPSWSKSVVVCTVISSGGLVAYCDAKPEYANQSQKKKVVVLGTGWAGTSFLKNMKSNSYDIHVVSPRNYFAFTPLLPSVTCGTVEARSVVEPIRSITRKSGVNIHFSEAECYKIDNKNNKVYCRASKDKKLGGQEDFSIDYDYLVIAMGGRSNTFNTPGVQEHAHFLKEVDEALKIRHTVVDLFERASLPSLPVEEKKKLLSFVVVGGGPTGVEFAAELHDFVLEDMAKLYPSLKDYVKITLLEAGDHILNMFDKRITEFAEQKFARDGIDVRLGSMVVKVGENEITAKERSSGQIVSIPHGMVVWSTGIGARPEVVEFMKQLGQVNRRALVTDEWLRVEGSDNIYALGDCATINQRRVMEDIAVIFSKADKNNSGKLDLQEFKEVVGDIIDRYPQVDIYLKKNQMKDMASLLKKSQESNIIVDIEYFKEALSKVDSQMKNLPATAQVAAQQGVYLANCFNRMEECEKYPEGPLRFRGVGRHRFRPFRYKHLGQFAPLGGEQTAAQLPGDWISIGQSTQWLWYSVYTSKQVSWRTRFLVVGDWGRRFIFGRDSRKDS